jgi:type I restriction enzyme M protein
MSEQADKALQDKVNKAVWNACDTFRGTVDPSIYKDYVLTMLFVKYLSDVWQDHYDQLQKEHGEHPELIKELLKSERFQLPENAHFSKLYELRETPGNGERIDKALSAIEEANLSKLGEVFQDITFNSNKLGEEKQKNDILKHVLQDFASNELDLRPSKVGNLDIIGNAYEFLIKSFASTSGKSAGEFYTPPEVSELIAELVAPQEGDEICDPACGSGSLLLKCANQITKVHAGSKKYALYGQEAIGSTWALAKMNMFLHSQDNHRLEWGDTIRNPKILEDDNKLKHFDIVVANPPFSLDKWGVEIAQDSNDKFSRFGRGVPPKTKGDYAFILHMIETLNPAAGGKSGGKMGVVVPHGVLFRGSSEGKIRQQLVDEGLLRAVIGLPEKLFYGTGIPAAILIFSKQQINRDVLFIDASREFTSGKNQNQLSADNIKKVVDTFEKRQSDDKYAYLATLEEIKANDYNLNIPRYVDTFEEEEEIDLMAVRKKRLELQDELAEIEKQMANYLTELGYE